MGHDRFVTRPGAPWTSHRAALGAAQERGNRPETSIPGVDTPFASNAGNRLTARTDTIGGRSVTVGYAYDGRDNLVRVTYPSGRQVWTDYDAGNRATKVSDGTGRSTRPT
jgi:YD repeat-containing protein